MCIGFGSLSGQVSEVSCELSGIPLTAACTCRQQLDGDHKCSNGAEKLLREMAGALAGSHPVQKLRLLQQSLVQFM